MKQSPRTTENRIDEFAEQFSKRYIFKKKINALQCFFIAICGTTAVLYSKFVFNHSILERLRYMTFWGTIFTTIVSFICGIVCIYEAVKEIEITNKTAYFLRLSSATAELVIFAVVMIGLTQLVPDQPDISTYPGFMMHLVIPIATVLSFILNDAPIGKPKMNEPLKGMLLIFIYAVVMMTLFESGILSSDEAPYSFLDFDEASLLFTVGSFAGILTLGYAISWMLMRLNMKLSWIWFYDINRLKKKG